MGQPHKHAELIKLWADGAEIQTKDCGFGGNRWRDAEIPCWSPNAEYRIKPKTIRYRLALLENEISSPYTFSCNTQAGEKSVERYESFVRWLGDWQEVVVE